MRLSLRRGRLSIFARRSKLFGAALSALVVLQFSTLLPAHADSTAQSLPFSQDWSNTGLITANDNWSGVPGIVGYRGDDLTTATGTDPQTILADGTSTPVNVFANQTNPNTFLSGGVAEFELSNPTVALNGSGTADAPFILLNLNTTGRSNITVAYNLRDLDASADNAVQPVALQFRVGNSGSFTNVPAGFVADATTGPGQATLVTPVSAVLPSSADNQPLVQVRVITANAAGNDEWVGIDDIQVTGSAVEQPTNPSGAGTAGPASVAPGGTTTLTVTVTPGANPASTGLSVTADLTSIGGSGAQTFADAGNNTFTFQATVASDTAAGQKIIPVTVTDAQGRAGSASITLTVEQNNPADGNVVISQIYGGGGNSGATYRHDYVELYNLGNATVDVTGWSLQYTSATGSTWGSNTLALAGTVAPGQYYLVGLSSGGANGAEIPQPNMAGDINMSATAGKLALVSNSDPLSGACPTSDPDVVDFVGYGATANCREGGANAPAPSNTTAIFRAGGGSQDTNQNGSDFAAAAPLPRRSAPLIEVGPSVANTDPATNGTNAPRDASITVTFSEPVNVAGAWYNINCVNTGNRNDATVYAHPNGRTFVVTPNTNFAPGEQCTVTIASTLVSDQDADDGRPDTDNLAADYTWSFTVAAGAPPPYPPSVHLTMGNPSGATADLNNPNNYLMEKPEYALSYNRDRGIPNWVSWHLASEWVGSLQRNDTFRPDPQVPADWYRVQAFDYTGSGFDRGHMVPNADRDNENSIPINQATFLMTNILPQAPDNNQGPWANLENYLRTLLPDSELYIVAGGAGTGGTGANGPAPTIADGKVAVPAQTWKVALVVPKGDGDDVARVTTASRTIAVIMPNQQGIRTTDPNDWQNYLTSVDAVENLTGYDFFSNLPDPIEDAVEAGVNGRNPVTASVSAVSSGLFYNRTTRTYSGTITLTNTSGAPIAGPVQVILDNLTPDVDLVNKVGVFQGDPYIAVTIPELGPGASVSVPVRFSNPSNVRITYTTVVYSGSF